VSSKTITTDPEKLKAMWEWPTPKNKHDIRSFLGLCTYYRQLISGFANIVKPPAKFTEEKQAFQWTPKVEGTLQTLKEALSTAPILAHLQPREMFVVDTGASNIGIRGVLSQVQGGQEQVIACYSKMLNEAKRNYCVTRRQLLAIVRILEHFHKYLYGQEFHLCTCGASSATPVQPVATPRAGIRAKCSSTMSGPLLRG
jgi:hypothetical protein